MDRDALRELWEKTLGGRLDAPDLAPGRTYKPKDGDAPGSSATGTLPRATLSGGGTLAGSGTLSGGGTLAGGGTLSGGGTLPPSADGDAADGGLVGAGTGQFELLQELGRGGMGVVFRARQESLRREVAIKRLLQGKGDAATKERFLAEALVTGVLDHPNVVPVHELGLTPEGELFMAMKLVGGTSWADLLHPRTPEQQERARRHDREAHVQILLAVGNAIAFAHSRGIVHRDLKPENVMVGDFGEVLVMDWGIAVDVSERPRPDARAPHRTSVVSPSGTPSYMPPELAEGRGAEIGPATDVYLLGACLHEVLTGAPPHQGRTLVEVLLAASRSAPPRYGPDVPQGLAAICTKAMARDPKDRHASVAALQDELRAYLKHRESLLLSERADEDLRALESAPGDDRDRRYERFARAIARYEQALDLWADNAPARIGARRARLAHAREALARGDLGLAAAQAAPLPADDADAGALRQEVASAQAERAAAARRARALRVVAGLSIVAALAALGVGYVLVSRERDRAVEAQEKEAEQRQAADAAKLEAQARTKEARERLRHLLTQRSQSEKEPTVGALHLIATLGPDLEPDVERIQRLRIRALLEATTPPARTFALGWSELAAEGATTAAFDAKGRAWALTREGVVQLSLDDPSVETVGAPIALPPREYGDPRYGGALIPVGDERLLVASNDLVMIDLERRAVAWQVAADGYGALVEPSGQRLLVQGPRLLDVATGEELRLSSPVPGATVMPLGLAGGQLWGRAVVNYASVGLFRLDLATSEWTRVQAPEGRKLGDLALASPDGDAIVVATSAAGGSGFDLIALDGATGAPLPGGSLVNDPLTGLDEQNVRLAFLGGRRLAALRRVVSRQAVLLDGGDVEAGRSGWKSASVPWGGPLGYMVASRDGRLLAVAVDGLVHVLDTRTGRAFCPPLEGLQGSQGDVRLSFSPDGGLLLGVDTQLLDYERGSRGPVRLWRLAASEGPTDRGELPPAEELALVEPGSLDEPGHALVFDDQRGYDGGGVIVKDRRTGEERVSIYRVPTLADEPTPEPGAAPPTTADRVWDVGARPKTMASSRDGAWVAFGGALEAPIQQAWEREQGEASAPPQPPRGLLRVADAAQRRWLPWERVQPSVAPELQFLPDGKRLAVLWGDALELIDVAANTSVRVELPPELRAAPPTGSEGEAEQAPPSFVRVAPEVPFALLVRGAGVCVAALHGGAPTLGPAQRLGGVAVLAELFAGGRRAFVASGHEVLVLDLERQAPAIPPLRVGTTVNGVEPSPDGRFLVVLGNEARVFDLSTGSPVGGPIARADDEYAGALELAFAPRGGLLAVARSGALQLWELGTALPVTGVLTMARSELRGGELTAELTGPRFDDAGRTLLAKAKLEDDAPLHEVSWTIEGDARPVDELRASTELRAGRRLDASGYPVPLTAAEAAARAATVEPPARVSAPPRPLAPEVVLDEPAFGARVVGSYARVRATVTGASRGAHAVVSARGPAGRTARRVDVGDGGLIDAGWISFPPGDVVTVEVRVVGDGGLEGSARGVVRVDPAPAPAPPEGARPVRTEKLSDGREVEVWERPLPAGPPLELVHVPAGPYAGGTQLATQGLWVARTEVTWAQYAAFCRATGRAEPLGARPKVPDSDRHPARGMTWRDAAAFAEWAGAALPTEGEWQRFARVEGRRYPWGDTWEDGRCSHGRCVRSGLEPLRDASDGYEDTAPVGSFPDDCSSFGVLDVMGNVEEWVADDVDGKRKACGGSFKDGESSYVWLPVPPDKAYWDSTVGLRVVLREP